MRTFLVLPVIAFFVAGLVDCGGSSEPAKSPVPTPPAAAAATPEAKDASVDLGTPEKARAAIKDALLKNDKAAFKKCVSKRMLAAHEAKFDDWYAVWKKAADASSSFDKITLTQEDGAYKLDEN